MLDRKERRENLKQLNLSELLEESRVFNVNAIGLNKDELIEVLLIVYENLNV